MERISNATIGWNGLLPSLETAITNWQPGAQKNELAYSNSLASHLRAVLPADMQVQREYRHEGTTCDLCVMFAGFLLVSEDRIFIEVKRNLRKKADCDRLVGQIEGLKPKSNKIVLVLIGDTDPALVGRLRSQFRPYLENDTFLGTTGAFRIVVVDQRANEGQAS